MSLPWPSYTTEEWTKLLAMSDAELDAFLETSARMLGGPGSGFFGHRGRPGQVGGSTDEQWAADVGAGTGGGNPMIPWKDKGGFEHTGITWQQATNPNTGRPIPIKVETVEEAAALVLEGKVVEVKDVQTAFTLIDKLAADALEAKKAGKDAKEYDLCSVSVAGTNLFCAETLKKVTIGEKYYEDGIPRVEMPQLGGKPVPGTEAAKLPRNPWDETEVDGSKVFIHHLQSIGVKTTEPITVLASSLKASQMDMQGPKVGKMMRDKTFDPAGPKNPLFVSNDGYIIDGHHRWAAAVGRDLEDGVLGNASVTIIRVDAPISEALHLATAWSVTFGIQQAPGVIQQAKTTGIHASSLAAHLVK